MFKFKLFWKLFKYTFYVLFLRNFYKYSLIFFPVLISTSVLFSILQTELLSFQKNNEVIEKSNKFDFYFELPSKKRFLRLKQGVNGEKLPTSNSIRDVVKQIIKERKKQFSDFDSVLISKAAFSDFKNKKYFSFEVGFFDPVDDQPKINKIVLTAGRRPVFDAKNPDNESNFEIVLNSKFAKANNILLGDKVNIFNRPFIVVGFGDAVHNLSLNFQDTFKIQQVFNLHKQKVNLYHYFGIAYANEQLFKHIGSGSGSFNFNDFKNSWYFKFPSQTNLQEQKNFFLNAIRQKMNYDPRVVFFQSDLSSGLKTTFTIIELVTLGVVYFFIFLFLSFWLCFLVNFTFSKKKKLLSFINVFGFSKKSIAFSSFLTNFFLLFLATTAGFFFTLPLSDYFVSFNEQSFFLSFDFSPFQWQLFLFQILVLPFCLALISGLYIFYRCKYEPYGWQGDKSFLAETQMTFFHEFKWKKLFSWFALPFKVRVFFSFSFQGFWKKILLLKFIFLLFLLFFFLIFTKVSSDNFIYKQWDFLHRDVKSFTRLKEHIYLDGRQLKSEVDFVTQEWLDKQKLHKITDLNQLSLQSAGCIISSLSRDDLLACGLKRQYIDQTINSEIVQQYMKLFGVDKVYFNTIPYKKGKEILILSGNTTNDKLNTEVYFIPSKQAGSKWQEYFQISDLESKLPDFQFKKNSPLGIDSAGVQYALVPNHWKKLGYKLGDLIVFDGINFDYVFLNHKVQFTIAGFVSKNKLIRNIVFTDYNYLLEEDIVKSTSQKRPYNFVFSSTDKKHLSRHLVLNLTKVAPEVIQNFQQNDSFFLNLFSLINLESLTFSEFQNLSVFHFKIYQIYFLILTIFGLFLTFLFLLFLLGIISNSYDKTIFNLVLFGYQVKKLIWGFLISVTIFFSLGLVMAFGFALVVFGFLTDFFQTMNIYLVVPDLWNYFLYAFFVVFIVFLINAIYSFVYWKNHYKLKN